MMSSSIFRSPVSISGDHSSGGINRSSKPHESSDQPVMQACFQANELFLPAALLTRKMTITTILEHNGIVQQKIETQKKRSTRESALP